MNIEMTPEGVNGRWQEKLAPADSVQRPGFGLGPRHLQLFGHLGQQTCFCWLSFRAENQCLPSGLDRASAVVAGVVADHEERFAR